MCYSIRDVPRLLMTADGRWEIGRGIAWRLWPALRPAASLWRRTALAQTTLVAVVGSLGKTTATRCVAAALGEPAPSLPFNQFGLLAMNLLAIAPRRRRAVLEVGIKRPGEMAVYSGMVRPDVVVVTSIAGEHIGSMGNLQAIAAEKAEMVRLLSPEGTAVLNGDDPRVLGMQEKTRAKIITYGFDPGNRVRCLEARLDWPRGTLLTIEADGRVFTVRSRLFGRVMVYPALAAIAVALAAGIDPEEAARRLERLEPTPGRLDPVVLSSGAIVLRDDYKSPAESFAVAFDLLSEIPARRRFAVLGDVTEPQGSQGPLYREIAARLSPICDRAFLVGNCGRRWAAGLAAGGMAREKIIRCSGNLAATTDSLRRELGPGDVVLVKGRHEQRLERIAFALAGKEIPCSLPTCAATNLACDRCGGRGRASFPSRAAGAAPAQSEYSPGLLDAIEGSLWRRYNDMVVDDFVISRLDALAGAVVLKTDLFEEALGNDSLVRAIPSGFVGMDLSPDILKAARRRSPDARVVRADVRQLPMAGAALDGVISTSTLDHFHDPADLTLSLNELGRVLRPGGRLLLTLDNPLNPLLALRNVLPHSFRLSAGLTPYYVGYTCGPAQLERLLGEAGFEVRETAAILHFPRVLAALLGPALKLAGLDAMDTRILRLLQRAEILQRLPTRWFTGHYVAMVAVRNSRIGGG
jgi:UDP-N-acetylmuramoyl-tripeptide--D-alanyl-D-alanine ligase